MAVVNRRITLKERPSGLAGPEHFALDEQPVRAPGEGEALIETVLLSVRPAMRGWISANTGYVEPVMPGDVTSACGTGRMSASAPTAGAGGGADRRRAGGREPKERRRD